MVLVAVPVFGMTVVTTLVRTAHETPGTTASRASSAAPNLAAIGNARATDRRLARGNTDRATDEQVSDIGRGRAERRRARLANVTDFDLNNPVTKGAVLLRSGRFPAAAGEALVSPKIARAFGVGVGDELRSPSPRGPSTSSASACPPSTGTTAFSRCAGTSSTHRGSTPRSIKCSSSRSCACPGTRRRAHWRAYAPEVLHARQPDPTGHVARNVNWTLVAGVIALGDRGRRDLRRRSPSARGDSSSRSASSRRTAPAKAC